MKTRNVKVRAMTDPSGSVEFEVDGVKAKHARLKLDKDSGAHAIEFELQDHSGSGLQFNMADPIWICENCPCPPAPGLNSNQLSVIECDTQKLSTVNDNSGAQRELRYQLNFVKADGSVELCDPIIDNGGGNAN